MLSEFLRKMDKDNVSKPNIDVKIIKINESDSKLHDSKEKEDITANRNEIKMNKKVRVVDSCDTTGPLPSENKSTLVTEEKDKKDYQDTHRMLMILDVIFVLKYRILTKI